MTLRDRRVNSSHDNMAGRFGEEVSSMNSVFEADGAGTHHFEAPSVRERGYPHRK